MSVTRDLSAVEALRKAKQEGGFVRPSTIRELKQTDSKGRLYRYGIKFEGLSAWKMWQCYCFDGKTVSPTLFYENLPIDWLLEPWEHHTDSTTL